MTWRQSIGQHKQPEVIIVSYPDPTDVSISIFAGSGYETKALASDPKIWGFSSFGFFYPDDGGSEEAFYNGFNLIDQGSNPGITYWEVRAD